LDLASRDHHDAAMFPDQDFLPVPILKTVRNFSVRKIDYGSGYFQTFPCRAVIVNIKYILLLKNDADVNVAHRRCFPVGGLDEPVVAIDGGYRVSEWVREIGPLPVPALARLDEARMKGKLMHDQSAAGTGKAGTFNTNAPTRAASAQTESTAHVIG
jgi:hypothetical protein